MSDIFVKGDDVIAVSGCHAGKVGVVVDDKGRGWNVVKVRFNGSVNAYDGVCRRNLQRIARAEGTHNPNVDSAESKQYMVVAAGAFHGGPYPDYDTALARAKAKAELFPNTPLRVCAIETTVTLVQTSTMEIR